jgi:Tfp pilus assembly protein PilN
VRAVNLIPADAKGSGRSIKLAPATWGLGGVLVAALVLVTLYVLAGNTVADRQAQIASLQSQVRAVQAEATQLGDYTQFASLAQTRLSTVRGIAATRFDWNGALENLARVIPANTSLQSLNATVVPGATAGGSGAAAGLRADLPGPAFEMIGCTATQDDVARLISRLRAMPDVSRVALSSSTISAASATPAAAQGGAKTGCKLNTPTFSLTVFFQPVTGAGPTGVASLPGSSTATSTGGAQ